MKTRLVIAFVLAVLGGSGLLVACSSDDASAPPVAGPDATTSDAPIAPPADGGSDAASDAPDAGPDDLGPLRAFCADYAKAYCDRLAYCGGGDPGCAARIVGECHMFARAGLLDAIDAGLVTFDPAKAADCFATPFDDFCETGGLLFAMQACRGTFAGAVPNGGACIRVYAFGDVDPCRDGTCSVGEVFGACTAGVCQPRLDAGARCTDDAGTAISPGCANGDTCRDGTCVAEGKPGDPCANVGELCRPLWPQVACAPLADGGAGLACDFRRDAGGVCGDDAGSTDSLCRSFVCDQGRCTDRTADGGIACESPDPPCPSGTVCRPNGKGDPASCQAPIAANAPCAAGDPCVDGYTCAIAADASTGTCAPLPAQGAPCDGACAAGLACSHFDDAGTCAPVVGLAQPCRGAGDDTCAPGLTCNAASRTCVPPVSLGDPCADDRDCDPGLYCDDAAKTCRPWKRHGEPCGRDGECIYGVRCELGQCNSACVIP